MEVNEQRVLKEREGEQQMNNKKGSIHCWINVKVNCVKNIHIFSSVFISFHLWHWIYTQRNVWNSQIDTIFLLYLFRSVATFTICVCVTHRNDARKPTKRKKYFPIRWAFFTSLLIRIHKLIQLNISHIMTYEIDYLINHMESDDFVIIS